MNKLPKASLIRGRTLSFVHDTTFEGYALSYPIRAVKSCHYECDAKRIGDYNHAYFRIKALLTVEDSVDAVWFDKEVILNEDVDLMDAEDDEGEGFIIEGDSIDLDDLCLRIIHASLPIRLTRPGAKLPEGNDGARFLSMEEYLKESSEQDNGIFNGIDFEEEK